MQVDHRKPYILNDVFSSEERADLLSQIPAWESILDQSSGDTSKPEQYSSAIFLRRYEYFYRAKVILNATSSIELAAIRVTKLQRQLAQLRERSKVEQSFDARNELREHVRAKLKECLEERYEIWKTASTAHVAKAHLACRRSSFNKHLNRMRLPSDSLLRPEALLGKNQAPTAPNSKHSVLESEPANTNPSKLNTAKKANACVIDPFKEPELWLEHLPAFVMVDGERKNKQPSMKFVQSISAASARQRVVAALFFGYEVYSISALERFFRQDRSNIQQHMRAFRKHAKKHDPNWAEHFPSEQDIFRNRIATPRPR